MYLPYSIVRAFRAEENVMVVLVVVTRKTRESLRQHLMSEHNQKRKPPLFE
jgi:hypothetical protein